jgi:hypothetical protein
MNLNFLFSGEGQCVAHLLHRCSGISHSEFDLPRIPPWRAIPIFKASELVEVL